MSTAGHLHHPPLLASQAPPVPWSQKLPEMALRFQAIVLLGYAVAGKGFAYLGVPPLYVGECLLLAMAGSCLLVRGLFSRLTNLPAILLLMLCGWCAVQTLQHVDEYGMESLRDAAVWTYAGIAIAVAALCGARPQRLVELIIRYRHFPTIFVLAMPAVFFLGRFTRPGLPLVPGTNVPIISMKEADVLVHLAGILAFWTAGLGSKASGWAMLLLAGCAAVMGVIDRAGMVAFGAVFALCLLARPAGAPTTRCIIAIVIALAALWATDVSIEVPGGKGRVISFDQVVTNVQSIASDTGSDGLDSTKEWRIDWWTGIVDYTFRGEYFWTGKGFGVNLADDDGFQVQADRSLRSPHSAHMTFLARGGVPALVLWLASQAAWVVCIARAYFVSRARRQRRWESLFFFLFCYWLAFFINASFDVYLEGPVGGIWFWSLFGVGLAALDLHRRAPQTLDALDTLDAGVPA